MDWCETHKVETIRANVIGCLNLADVCLQRDIHMLYYGTGCIFHYDDEHPIGGKGFTEDDKPNFTGSYYSHTKVHPCMQAQHAAWLHSQRSDLLQRGGGGLMQAGACTPIRYSPHLLLTLLLPSSHRRPSWRTYSRSSPTC